MSFSIKQCRNFKIDPEKCLDWLIEDCGIRRFRLMSYWNEIERAQGKFDFSELDRQIDRIKKANGNISLCLGARQPRWPENHWPDWAWNLLKVERTKVLMQFIEIIIIRYNHFDVIVSYQLENEALLEDFGERPEVDRERLRQEFELVKRLDPDKPIIMTTSTSWGIPIRRPIPDIVGFSYYQKHFSHKKNLYKTSFHKPWLHKSRANLIKLLWQRPSFIHELQLEPWGPKAIWEMPFDEQMKSMNPEQIRQNLRLARKTGLTPIDLWGGEWWYWCKLQGYTEIPKKVIREVKNKS